MIYYDACYFLMNMNAIPDVGDDSVGAVHSELIAHCGASTGGSEEAGLPHTLGLLGVVLPLRSSFLL